jgi:hypothetical protein
MKLTFIFSILLIFLTSCGKNKDVKIIAKNVGTGSPFPGLYYEVVSNSNSYNKGKSKKEASGILNENGEAIVSIKQKSGRIYGVSVYFPENTCYKGEVLQFFDGPYDVEGTFTFEYSECAHLKFSIQNVNCINSNDELKYRSIWVSNNEYSQYVIQNGCYQLIGNYTSIPAGEYRYEWEVKRNGVTNYFDSTFTLVSNQYFDFNLNY